MASVNPVMQNMAMEVVATELGFAEVRMLIRPDMGNTFGVCHGGVLFSLADMCFGVAANSYNERAVTASAEIQFLAPAHVGDVLTATTRETWRGPRTAIYDVRVESPGGETAALMRARARILGGPVISQSG